MIIDTENKQNDYDIQLDLRGVTCPMTFVHTKVALEKMKEGEILKIILDYEIAFENVPKSVKKQNLGMVIKEVKENGIKCI